MRNEQREREAELAAMFIRSHFKMKTRPRIGVVLGTGWGDTLAIANGQSCSFNDLPGFAALDTLEGHARELVIGRVADKGVAVLRGRVHLNEAPYDPSIAKMVRLQTEMLFHLGVKKLIVTSAVGSLRGALAVGQIAIVDGFVTVFAPDMPLWAGEFCSPEDALSPAMRHTAHTKRGPLITREVGHVMVRGPFFEGRRYDKALLAQSGAGVVGMSMLPEACVAALYGIPVLGLGFVTNDDVEAHSHEENQARARASSEHLGGFLTRIISRL